MKPLITPEEISMLARPCYADEAKAMAYIYECEQNDIKKVMGDDLLIRLKEGEQSFLLDGGVYERNGRKYYLNGIKKALAYFVYSRLLESSSAELTRQGVVNRRSDMTNEADDEEIISVSRKTLAIADCYMQEVAIYLGIDEAESSQRTKIMVINGSNSVTTARRSVTATSSGGGAGADLSNYATKSDLASAVSESKTYTDQEIDKIDIPDVSGFVTDEQLSVKADKVAIVTATDIAKAGERTIIDVTDDVAVTLEGYADDGYAHTYEIVLNVGDTAYSVAFPADVVWVRDLEIEANKTYYIVIEDSVAMWTSIDQERR